MRHYNKGAREDAVGHLKQAAQLEPDVLAHHLDLADALFEQGRRSGKFDAYKSQAMAVIQTARAHAKGDEETKALDEAAERFGGQQGGAAKQEL